METISIYIRLEKMAKNTIDMSMGTFVVALGWCSLRMVQCRECIKSREYGAKNILGSVEYDSEYNSAWDNVGVDNKAVE